MVITYEDMKRVRNLFEELTNKKVGFSSKKKEKGWRVFEIEEV